jgi:hypothetical protein
MTLRARQAATAVTTRIVALTPAMAEALLAANIDNNRGIRDSRVAALVRDMLSGRFCLNGETIKVSVTGRLLDGQHRCMAVLQSGVTIQAILVEGLPEATLGTIDMGQRRSVAQSLKMRGEPQPTAIAAIARRILMWDAGVRTNASGSQFLATEREITDFIERTPAVRHCVDVSRRAASYVCAPTATIGLAYFLCSRVDAGDASTFFIDQLTDGLGLHAGDPAKALRDRFAVGSRRGRVAEADALGYTLRAWNAYRRGDVLTKMQAPTGGWNNTNIPTPI